MLRTLLFALLILPTLVTATSRQAVANLVFTYDGAPFDDITTAGVGKIEAQFSFSGPISDGATLSFADVTNWSMQAAGSPVFSAANGATPVGDWIFTFGDVGGEIMPVIWEFAAELNFAGDAGRPEQIGSTTAFEFVEEFGFGSSQFLAIDDFFANDPAAAALGGLSSASSAGTWSVVAIPEPSAFLCGGLVAGIAGLRRPRRRSNRSNREF